MMPFPLDFVAARAGPEGLEVRHFAAGREVEGARGGARLVVHDGVSAEMRHAWEASGGLCIDAERLLALLAPEEPQAAFTGAGDIAARYLEAARGILPQSEVLRLVAEVLPESAAVERWILHQAVGNLAVGVLSSAREATVRCTVAPDAGAGDAVASRAAAADAVPGAPRGPFAAPDWREMAPHALLDSALLHLMSGRREPGAVPFEARPGQVEMAHAVLDTLVAGGTLAVEAGTGVGKTIAYALPVLVLAARDGGRFLLSTHTRNLQQQLVGRDLPELRRSFGLQALSRSDEQGTGLRFAKLVGRSNYVCRAALRRQARVAIASGGSLQMAQLLLWSLRTASGELEELAARPGFEARLLREVASRRETCLGRSCRGDISGGAADGPGAAAAMSCPVHAAREAARAADIVAVNHALLFSDALSEGNILGSYDGLVVDEAQNLVSVATENLALRLGRPQAEELAAPVARLLAEARGLRAGPEVEGRRQRLDLYATRVGDLGRKLEALLDALDLSLPRGGAARGRRQRYRDGDEVFAPVRAALGALVVELEACAAAGLELAEDCRTLVADEPRLIEITAWLDLLVSWQRERRAALEFLSRGDNEDWAFYLEFEANGSGPLREVAAAPLEVGAEVQRLLAAPGRGAVYTSATLAVGGSFEYFRQRAGLGREVREMCVASPFDYASQCLVVQAQHLQGWSDPDFEAQVADVLAEISQQARRRMLVLLTSHAALRRLHAELRQRLGPRWPLLGQEISGSRVQLAELFARQPGAILLGTSSFWEGVDFPGEALEVLVIVKLPFLVPEEPLVAARCERLRARGDSPFPAYVLPEAILRFKQGFGRLIRSRRDRGVALLLDSRLGERGYGAGFLGALPVVPEVFYASEAIVQRVVGWLQEESR